MTNVIPFRRPEPEPLPPPKVYVAFLFGIVLGFAAAYRIFAWYG